MPFYFWETSTILFQTYILQYPVNIGMQFLVDGHTKISYLSPRPFQQSP